MIVPLRHSAMTHVHVPSPQNMLLQSNSRHWLAAVANRKVLIAIASVAPHLHLSHNKVIAQRDLNNDDSAAVAVDGPYMQGTPLEGGL